ncbi:tetratricopeptide repeat-containing sensor histidine kinase [Chondrinema litorale]|uniref:tetratricopeptide repeat-containing sensor histidine kinase n=1 Tax=Chondrinema litorale TaxID=2994555 RepID=UPI0025437570|nr:tetratricopeptide repeat protein [Chondrinema litorale]UZR97950.1 tetratricopeptide repeat protein [Chondrinema litorale]
MLSEKTLFNRKNYITICCLFVNLLTALQLAAQQEKIDSLLHELDNSTSSFHKADVLLELSFYSRNSKPNLTIDYAKEALIISQEVQYPKGHAQALRNIGLGNMKLGNYDSAVILCNKALEVANEFNVEDTKADVLNTLGNIYYHQAMYEDALNAFIQTVEIYEKTNRPIDIAGSYTNIGSILDTKGDLERALEYFNKSLLLFEKHNHLDGIATVSNNMAAIFLDEGDVDKALEYFQRTASIDSTTNNIAGFAKTISNIAGIKLTLGDTTGSINDYRKSIDLYDKANANCNSTSTLSSLGDLYLKQNQLDSAYFYINNAVKLATDCNNIHDLIGSYVDFGKYYKKTGNNEKAIYYFKKSYEIAAKQNVKPVLSEAAKELYLIYKKLNNSQEALKYLEINNQLDNELFNAENTRKIAKLEAAYDLEKEKKAHEHESRLSQLKFEQEINQQKFIQKSTLAVLLVITIMLIIICWLLIHKSKFNKKLNLKNKEVLEQNKQITQQQIQLQERSKIVEAQKLDLVKANKELKELNEEKNTLIGIVAHDLKSPINQIKGLITLSKMEMQKEDIPEMVLKNFELMETSSQRSLDMIDRILNVNAIESKDIQLNIETVETQTFFKELENTFKMQAQAKNIKFVLDIEDVPKVISVDKNLLNEILENLVSNAIKFSPENTEIRVGVNSINNNLQFYVKDQGPGINETDKKIMFNKYQRLTANPTANESSTGLGLAIVKKLTEELGGKVFCESEVGNGATFFVELKK